MSNTETKKEKTKKEIEVVYEADGEQIRLTPSIVQNYIVGTDAQITIPEFKFFTSLCKARGLNPFLKEAYCIKYKNNPAQIVVGKDAVLKRAIKNPNYDGMESGVIIQNKETGEITERKGTFYLRDSENIVGGWAKVYRKDWQHPTYCSVAFDEVAQKKSDGELNSNWSGKGATMVEKVAKVRALRETFVEELGGMYEAEEMGVDLSSETQSQEIVQQDEPIEVDATPVENVVNMDEI
ncbi:MAG: phage recombination protein Bet [Eubacterium coprostanoligenes]|uniref:phage recombination protein Bet n=1 Tax=Eubacterium coprostanoligenes TaxID=290054 RepID=UPI0023EF99D4|nr:phage recombination protein Bet [Eubacterium coprostanoligenes]MDD7357515.1 phage recombination protein Bet [Eubacterium coprostanoligenes]